MTQNQLIHQMLHAKSREEVIAARAARDAWIEENPDDDQVFEAGESLEMLAEAYKVK